MSTQRLYDLSEAISSTVTVRAVMGTIRDSEPSAGKRMHWRTRVSRLSVRKKGLICIVRVGSVDFCVMARWLTIVDGRVVVSIQQSKGRGGVLAYFVFCLILNSALFTNGGDARAARNDNDIVMVQFKKCPAGSKKTGGSPM